MATLHAVLQHVLDDRRITINEVKTIRQFIERDGKLDLQDMKVLVELLSNASDVCPEFDELFFPMLEEVVLEDGKIGRDEQFYLLKMLYSDGNVREQEKQFLLRLREQATEVPAEFDGLCETALDAHPTNWSVGGASR